MLADQTFSRKFLDSSHLQIESTCKLRPADCGQCDWWAGSKGSRTRRYVRTASGKAVAS